MVSVSIIFFFGLRNELFHISLPGLSHAKKRPPSGSLFFLTFLTQRSIDREASIDDKVFARDHIGLITRQEKDSRRDLIGLSEAMSGDLFDHIRLDLALPGLLTHVGVNDRRRDTVHIDAIFCPLQRADLDHTDQCGLAHGIADMLVDGDEISLGSDADDLAAFALLDHLVGDRLANTEYADRVDVQVLFNGADLDIGSAIKINESGHGSQYGNFSLF